MRQFSYVAAADVGSAVDLMVRTPGARYLAGGTNLVDLIREGVEKPVTLVDVTSLPLTGIEELPDGGLRIGALVRNSDRPLPRWYGSASPSWPRPSWPARRLRSVTWPPPAGTSCSAPGAGISTTSRRHATSGSPEPAAPRWGAGSTGCTRCWAPATAASRCTRPTWPSRWPPLTPWSR